MLDENKFNELKKEYKNILEKLASPELISDFRKLEELSKKESHIKKIIEKNEELIGAKKNISENENIITSNEDEELTKIAEEEINQDNEKIKILEEELKTILEGSKEKIGEIIMEIRPGAGGEESALFAKKIFDMYARFAENKNWKITILSATETNLRGLKEIIFNVKNGNVFDILKYEAGVHRVQRIPETEKSGRTHTSTVTVAILPKAKDEELEIKPQDLRIDTYRASGPGGQYVNKRESAVRITHMPTGIAVASQTSRTQLQNRENALKILKSRILAKKQEEESKKTGEERKEQVGMGMRAEKIRTYNFPQDRITDHRIKKSWHGIEKIMAGDLEPIINELKKEK